MLFIKKLQNEKRAKERRKKRGRKRGDEETSMKEEKKSRFDVENLQKVELTDEDLKLIMQILDEQDVKSEMMKSTREDPDPKKKNDVDESLSSPYPCSRPKRSEGMAGRSAVLSSTAAPSIGKRPARVSRLSIRGMTAIAGRF